MTGAWLSKLLATLTLVVSTLLAANMTVGGRALQAMENLAWRGKPVFSREAMAPLWEFASSRFAKGATDFATFVVDPAGYRGAASVWQRIELPALREGGVTVFRWTVGG